MLHVEPAFMNFRLVNVPVFQLVYLKYVLEPQYSVLCSFLNVCWLCCCVTAAATAEVRWGSLDVRRILLSLRCRDVVRSCSEINASDKFIPSDLASTLALPHSFSLHHHLVIFCLDVF